MKVLTAIFMPLLVAVIGLSGLGTNAHGQDYPNRPVRILVGYAPGGTPDNVARTVGEALSKIFGQPFVVEHKPGAAGTLATAAVARSPADGYTLLGGETGQLEIAPNLLKEPPYDTLKDLTPISIVATTPVIFVSGPKTQIRTIKDLIREAKANPGKLNYGSAGIGSIHQIIFEAFNTAAGVKLTHIPFKGGPAIIPALLAGDVQVMLSVPAVLNAQRQAGTINLLGVSSIERFPFTPDAPSISDDLKGFEFASETGILAPAGLPPELLAKLSRALKTASETPEMQDRFRKLALLLTWTTPDAYRERIRQNLKKYGEILRTSNITAN